MNRYNMPVGTGILVLLIGFVTNCLGFPNRVTIGKILTKNANPEIWHDIGDDVILNCTVLSGGPVRSIKWKKHGSLLHATQRGPRWSVLVIKGVRERDAGKYKCIVRGWSKDISQVHLHVRGPPRFLKGAASRSSSPLFLIEGETITLNCFATAEPKPTFYWEKDGKLIKSVWGSPYHYIHRANGVELMIISPSKDQEGLYTCVVRNEVGNTTYNVRVFVKVSRPATPPKISAIEANVTAEEGSNVSLSCSVKCTPKVNVETEWFNHTTRIRSGKRFEITEKFYLDPKGGSAHVHMVNTTLTIRRVSISDTRRYVCVAWSANSWIKIPEDTIQLTVLPKAKATEKVGQKPVVESKPQPVSEVQVKSLAAHSKFMRPQH